MDTSTYPIIGMLVAAVVALWATHLVEMRHNKAMHTKCEKDHDAALKRIRLLEIKQAVFMSCTQPTCPAMEALKRQQEFHQAYHNENTSASGNDSTRIV